MQQYPHLHGKLQMRTAGWLFVLQNKNGDSWQDITTGGRNPREAEEWCATMETLTGIPHRFICWVY